MFNIIIIFPLMITGNNWASLCENRFFAYAKTKTQISAFVFAIRIVQSLYHINLKFQVLWLYSPVCVGPGRKPRIPVFSQRGSILPIVILRLISVHELLKNWGLPICDEWTFPSLSFGWVHFHFKGLWEYFFHFYFIFR